MTTSIVLTETLLDKIKARIAEESRNISTIIRLLLQKVL